MGTQGLRTSAVLGRPAAGQSGLVRIAVIATSVAMVPFVAGCSSFSSPFSSSNSNANQAASVPPPPNYPVAAAGQQAYPPPAGQTAYAARPGQQAYAPPSGQPAYAPSPGQQAYAPPAAAPPPDQGTVGSLRQGYVNFLQAFRDPPEPDPSAPPGYDARASTYPQQSLADAFKGSAGPGQATDPNGAGYPQQSLINRNSAAPAQQASMPHPPGTYVPSQQPYVPPQGQPAYGQPAQQNYPPPPAQQNYAQPPAQQGYAPRPQSYAPPPAQPAYAAAAPAAKSDSSDSLPYPKQSLADLFRGSTETQSQTMPHPPSAYTPSGQPYSPPGQPASGTPAPGATAAAPPANPTDSLPYPKQSLSDIFSNN
jgi:hypothetical protein